MKAITLVLLMFVFMKLAIRQPYIRSTSDCMRMQSSNEFIARITTSISRFSYLLPKQIQRRTCKIGQNFMKDYTANGQLGVGVGVVVGLR